MTVMIVFAPFDSAMVRLTVTPAVTELPDTLMTGETSTLPGFAVIAVSA